MSFNEFIVSRFYGDGTNGTARFLAAGRSMKNASRTSCVAVRFFDSTATGATTGIERFFSSFASPSTTACADSALLRDTASANDSPKRTPPND